jgi:hypothetical protein
MRFRFQPWQLAALLVLLCAAVLGILEWRRNARHYDASRLMQALPLDGAVKLYLDVEKLRDSGVLDQIAGKKASEDPDYRSFADEIGFDYRTDLDGVAAAWVNGGFYATARGHFDWKRLNEYARAQQGRCVNAICTMPGSQPDRMISFYPVNTEVLALAVSESPQGVAMIAPRQNKGFAVPPAILWISAPGPAFKNLGSAPEGVSAFLSPLADAREASFSLQPKPASPGATEKLEIHMDVDCVSPAAASVLEKTLSTKTDFLRAAIVREKLAPGKSSLSGVLVSGRFESHDAKVTGIWPMDRGVIEALVSGQVK